MPTKRANLIEVSVVGSLPPGLLRVAALDYSGVAPPANLRAIGATWGSLASVFPNNDVRLGAVRYVAGVATPAGLVPIAAVVPQTRFPFGTLRWPAPAIVPTLGAELLTNGNMETGSPPSSWAANNSTLTGVADERTGGAGAQSLDVANSGGFGEARQSVTLVVGTWYQLASWIKSGTTTGKIRTVSADIASITSSGVPWAQYIATGRATITGQTIRTQNQTSTGVENCRYDDISLKALTLSSCLGGGGDIAIKNGTYRDTPTLTSGTQCGFACCLDSITAPTYGIFVYHDGTNIHLVRLEASVWQAESINTAAAYVAGKEALLVIDGNQLTLYYNAVKIGATQTIDLTSYGTLFHGFSTLTANGCGPLRYDVGVVLP